MGRLDLLQGTLDLLILRAVALEAAHGLGISRRISAITGGTFDVQPGSLFPSLHRLEERGWLKSAWGESENRRRAKYYTITTSGRRQLREETREWEQIALAITRALQST